MKESVRLTFSGNGPSRSFLANWLYTRGYDIVVLFTGTVVSKRRNKRLYSRRNSTVNDSFSCHLPPRIALRALA